MSQKKKNLSPENKKDSLKRIKSPSQQKLQKEKPNKGGQGSRKSLLMTEEIALVSANVPLVSREIPLVSGYVPLVSSRPAITIPRYWGLLPSRQWGRTGLSTRRKRELRPTDIGLLKFLGKVLTAPYQPVEMVTSLAKRVHEIAEEEEDIKAQLEKELLELKMRYEMGEISEEKYKKEESKLKKRLKEFEK